MSERQDRRNFLMGALRGIAAGGVVGGAVALARRNGIDREAHVCLRDGICSGCGKLSSCILPQAESRKRAIEDSKKEGK